MPTYFARGVSAHLGAMPLADVVTPSIIVKKGDAAKEQAETVEELLLGSRQLKEELVPFPGNDDSFQLNWLGNAPFMQARVVCDQEGTRDTSQAAATTDYKPQALVLHVELSSRTFVTGLYGEKTSLKIDVLLNGQLTTSWFMPTHDVRSGVKGHHQVFAGTRVDFLAERPWVILPPGLGADGATRKKSSDTSVEQRWKQICQALHDEACQRGTNEAGGVPPTAEFLGALASMQMPEQVRDMQRAGAKVFGTIDLVITAGEGRKLTSGIGYLKAPRRLADENYPFIFQAGGATKLLRGEETGRNDSEPELQDLRDAVPEAVDKDAEGDIDPDYERQPKRQALECQVLAMQNHPSDPAPASHCPVTGPSKPAILPPFQTKSGSLPQSAAGGSHAVISPLVARSAGRTSMPSSPERSQRHGNPRDEHVYANGGSGAQPSVISPNYPRPNLPPNLHAPQMLPSPYTLHFSDPVLNSTAPSQLIRQAPSANNSTASSPLDRFQPIYQGSAFYPSFPASTQMARRSQVPFSAGPHTSPFPMCEQERRSSLDKHFSPRNYHPSVMGPPLIGPPGFSAPVPNMLPRAPTPSDLHGPRPLLMSYPPYAPFDRRLSGPLPPAALYTVPTKPRRSVSPQKDDSSWRSSDAQSSLLVSRLVISGLEGVIVIDQSWAPAKRIDLAESRTIIDQARIASPAQRTEILSPEVDAHVATGPRRSRRNTVKMDTVPPTSPKQPNDPGSSSEPNDNTSASKPGLHAPAMGKEIVTKKIEQLVMVPATGLLRAIKPMPQRRNASSSSILGVHGPKANPYLFDDPEEILREAAARKRRSGSPVKRDNTSTTVSQPREIQPLFDAGYSCRAATSSPLSSLHTTPEPEEPDMEPAIFTRALQKPIRSSTAPILQIDGSPERKIAPKTLQTPSPTKLTSAATPQLIARTPATPMSSASKKRKTQHRTLAKEPRSPGRLQTTSNPPLNMDCVIAYAESKDKKSEHGVLRQVKGERAGVFSEEYVVFACRFFVGEE
jgi:hypothetical protein